MFCDLQLTKDAFGLCRTDSRLENSTNIDTVFPNGKNFYNVNGKNITGWFSIDFNLKDFQNVSAIQAILSRSAAFDNTFAITEPQGLAKEDLGALWFNIQYPKFYEEHKLSVLKYLQFLQRRRVPLDYISSPEVEFLRTIAPRFQKSKLIFRFLDKDDIEPSLNETYDSILKNLKFLKTFAAGILVPKSYIWPQNRDLYLQAPTSLVNDAHDAGLEIYVVGIASDEFLMSSNYSYDPIREYLQFVDNNNFAVDGFLTDFSVTATEAIACYAHNNNTRSSTAGNPLIISHNGASGDYPGCTDFAYQTAIKDGADYIDCSVQITKDGVPFCRESPDLLVGTTVVTASEYYPSRLKSVPAIQPSEGIFTFDFTWEEIQGLTPNIFSPYQLINLLRNPAEANVGKYMNLTSFLDFAKNHDNIGLLINIENARALASELRIDVTNATISALKKAGSDEIPNRVMIQSDDSAVLQQFKEKTKFKLVYQVDAENVTLSDSVIKEIKEFADTVVLSRPLVITTTEQHFLIRTTDVVKRMHLHNMSVFVSPFRNEFASLAFDYFSDPTMQINTYVQIAKIDGLITDFPATAKAYLGNACLKPRTPDDPSLFLVNPGSLLQAMSLGDLAPSLAPYQDLSGVVEPPLPSVIAAAPSPAHITAVASPTLAKQPKQPNKASHTKQSRFPSLLMGFFILLFYFY